jgi:uncharacterized Fe-S cluster protein YjdI/CDGSH-type Zn-finger protein
MATREYVGAGITVHWDGDRCFHSERCTRGLPAVFDHAARPWVDADGASADEVATVIDTCPSGALSYTRSDGKPNGRRGRTAAEDPAASVAVDPSWEATTVEPGSDVATTIVTIRPLADGPLAVSGPVGIARPDGTLTVAEHWQLCRCGHSGAKPFCDGSHFRVGFTAPGSPDAGPVEPNAEVRR